MLWTKAANITEIVLIAAASSRNSKPTTGAWLLVILFDPGSASLPVLRQCAGRCKRREAGGINALIARGTANVPARVPGVSPR
jgi:hypothetical protein